MKLSDTLKKYEKIKTLQRYSYAFNSLIEFYGFKSELNIIELKYWSDYIKPYYCKESFNTVISNYNTFFKKSLNIDIKGFRYSSEHTVSLKRLFNEDELTQIFEVLRTYSRGYLYLITLCYYETGLLSPELFALKHSDVDSLKMSVELKMHLKNFPRRSKYLFCNIETKKQMTRKQFIRQIKLLIKKHPELGYFTPTDLRYSKAYILMQQGENLMTIKKEQNHKNIATTKKMIEKVHTYTKSSFAEKSDMHM